MTLPCGHSPEDHDHQAHELQRQLAAGDISGLMPTLTTENLWTALQMASVEVLVRAPDDDMARQVWDNHYQLVIDTFFTETAEDSLYPDWWEGLREVRAKFLADAEKGGVELEAPVENDKPWPGQYL